VGRWGEALGGCGEWESEELCEVDG